MRAVAVHPGQPNSMHLAEVDEPRLSDIPDGRGVLVKVLRVGVDGTDKEINAAEYGDAPEGHDYLITGHECLGRVVAVGPNVPSHIMPGSLVVSTVRRPGMSVYDQIGLQDMTTDDVYFERGINKCHGYLAERYVEDHTYVLPLPDSLVETGVLLEPLTVAEKAINQAFEIQRRLRVWKPTRAMVLGSGTIGLLTTLALRLRVIEATGFSPLAFEAAQVLGKNGVLVLVSVTGGDRKVEVPSDAINQGFVLGNKVMVGSVNASPADFASGRDDLVKAQAFYPGWLEKLLTTPVPGLESYEQMLRELTENKDAIKVFVEVAREGAAVNGAGATTAAVGA